NGNGHNGHNGHNGSGSFHGTRLTTGKSGRDMLAIFFRQRRVLIVSFAGLFLTAALIYSFMVNRYEAQTEILVQQDERANPAVSGQPYAQSVAERNGVTPDQMTSELELLRCQDLLVQVVDATVLDRLPLSLSLSVRG